MLIILGTQRGNDASTDGKIKIIVLGCALEGLLVIAVIIVASRFVNVNWIKLYVRYTA